MHSDHVSYFYLASKSRLVKSLNSISGLIQGIAIDEAITPGEKSFLSLWLNDHAVLRTRHPYCEIIPQIEKAIEDEVLTTDERDDIVWLCDKLVGNDDFFIEAKYSLQQLHGVLAGIIADGEIREAELVGLRRWVNDNDHLKTCWPYDEIDSLITTVMADKRIDADEHKMLLQFFSDFVCLGDDRTVTNPYVMNNSGNVVGLCACCPEIIFDGSLFCFTGASSRYTRDVFTKVIEGLGGRVANGISRKLDYLIIGSEGNPCWAYACYGRKVEQAVGIRKEGGKLMIIHENDLHDAIADAG